jgi:hypothetical protein
MAATVGSDGRLVKMVLLAHRTHMTRLKANMFPAKVLASGAVTGYAMSPTFADQVPMMQTATRTTIIRAAADAAVATRQSHPFHHLFP